MPDTCRICGNAQRNQRYLGREMMFGLREQFPYFQCSRCRCLQIVEPPADMAPFYPPHYYSLQAKLPSPPKPLARLLLRAESHFRLHVSNDIFPPSRKRRIFDWIRKSGCSYHCTILDVGCGRGKLLHDLHRLGFTRLCGVDPYLPEEPPVERGIRILKRELQQLDERFDLIMMHHTLEHLDTPLECMRQAADRLNTSGVLLVRIPLIDKYAWREYGVDWFSLDAPRHLMLHSEKSFGILAEQSGLRIERVVYDSAAHQFWGSEQYRRDIHHRAPNSYEENPAASIFSRAQIRDYERRSRQLNAQRDGDAACFYLRRQDHGVSPAPR
ncbi:MAG: class I SAM-dependent methyltransferase [Myxococcota bacterium]|jgi:SAM-dependent methyltransferase|nr:class I SAM-dependent methyltransferase [Myxococcota bacterium]